MKIDTKNKKIFLISLICVGFAGIAYLLYLSGLLDFYTDKNRLIDFFHRHRAYAALIFIGLQSAQVVAAPIPGELTGFVGGVVFGPLWGMVYSMIGLSLGSWLAFMLARLFGRPLVERVASADTISRYDYVMKHKGLLLAFLLFLIPGFPKDLLCYLLGLGHMRQRDFLMVAMSGRLFGTALLTMGGTYFQNEHYGALFAVIAISLLVILIGMVYRDRIERWLRERGKEAQKPRDHR